MGYFYERDMCREFNQNLNLWETKQIEKTHAKENNHTHKTIFTWFDNLPTSTELQEFHYKIRRYNSAQKHSQETQFPIHPNSLSPTRQENTILLLMRLLLGFMNSLHTHGYNLISNLIYIFIYIYIYIYMSKSAALGIIFLVEFGLGLWQFKPHGPTSTLGSLVLLSQPCGTWFGKCRFPKKFVT